ncbi:hypothetical protein [Tractidigestivibacter sp.]|uniref:hypothetical protein n=1 Tax=Tractidigestivibacter sp. TaxID=2847320 RepID=UPI002A90A762|nr:hypothetical protein [Tractidigestivibacter sp.]MDY5272295.1 hypothetical protein [Tractidigestivibacter sp.]
MAERADAGGRVAELEAEPLIWYRTECAALNDRHMNALVKHGLASDRIQALGLVTALLLELAQTEGHAVWYDPTNPASVAGIADVLGFTGDAATENASRLLAVLERWHVIHKCTDLDGQPAIGAACVDQSAHNRATHARAAELSHDSRRRKATKEGDGSNVER